MKKKKKFLALKIILGILGIISCLILVLAIANSACCKKLTKYIESFDAVDYSGIDRVLPELDEETGYYFFTNEDSLRVCILSDIHIGAGVSSKERDMKTIYEVISMLQAEKPDFVILLGDNTFAVPGPVFNGGSSLNNLRGAKLILSIFEHEGVYFTTVFGNHDTESFDFTSRENIGKLYENEKYNYCVYNQDFTDDAEMPSVSNQIINIKNAEGEISNILLMMDTNSYLSNSIMASINWLYDTIHPEQIEWAKSSISEILQNENKETIPVLSFMHIPLGEYQTAYKELEANDFKDTNDTEFVSGVWKEDFNETLQTKIFFGGCSRYIENPEDADLFFETLGPDGLNCLEAVFCGHDHTNTGVVKYKGVYLEYNNSIDNSAYTDIQYSGLQRGCTRLTLYADGSWEEVHLNAYQDLGVSPNKFVDVYLDRYFGE